MWLCFLFGAWASRQGGRAVVNRATSIPLRSIPASPPLRASIPDAECLGTLPPSPPARGTSPLATPQSGEKPKTGADLPPLFHAARLRRSCVAMQATRVPEERKHGADLSSVSLKDGAGDLLRSAALHSEELPHPSKWPASHPQRAAPLATPERGKNGLPAADLPSVLCRASSPQPTSSSAPSGHDRRRPAAFLRLNSVRTEGRLFSGILVLLKQWMRSRHAARAGIASTADRPTPPATTRGAAPLHPRFPSPQQMALWRLMQKKKISKRASKRWIFGGARFHGREPSTLHRENADSLSPPQARMIAMSFRASSWRDVDFLVQ